ATADCADPREQRSRFLGPLTSCAGDFSSDDVRPPRNGTSWCGCCFGLKILSARDEARLIRKTGTFVADEGGWAVMQADAAILEISWQHRRSAVGTMTLAVPILPPTLSR